MENLKGYCGLHVIKVVTGRPLDEIYNDYKKVAKIKSNRWKGRTREIHRNKLLKKYGVKIEQLPTKKMTLRKFIEDAGHMSNANILIVRTTGHVQTVRHGKVTDQSGTFDIEKFWGKNKIVTSVYRVIKVCHA